MVAMRFDLSLLMSSSNSLFKWSWLYILNTLCQCADDEGGKDAAWVEDGARVLATEGDAPETGYHTNGGVGAFLVIEK